jgi:hypothetical protein
MGIARRMHHDFDVLIQRHQRLYQPFQRNALELVATHLRHLRLGHAGDRRRFGLAELALVEQLVELERERGLRRQFFGVLETRSSNTLSVLSGWSIRVIEFSRSPRSGRALLSAAVRSIPSPAAAWRYRIWISSGRHGEHAPRRRSARYRPRGRFRRGDLLKSS